MFDVGQITRDLQGAFRLFDVNSRVQVDGLELVEPEDGGNLATPENLARLLASLRSLTESIASQRMGQLASDFWLGGADAMQQWDADFAAWRARLVEYQTEVAKAPPGDRQDVLWSVTAPLLLGFYGGENSKLPQQRLDAVTPFTLANQIRVAEEWRARRWELFKSDIEAGAKDIVKGGIGIGTLVAVGIAAVVLARVLR